MSEVRWRLCAYYKKIFGLFGLLVFYPVWFNLPLLLRESNFILHLPELCFPLTSPELDQIRICGIGAVKMEKLRLSLSFFWSYFSGPLCLKTINYWMLCCGRIEWVYLVLIIKYLLCGKLCCWFIICFRIQGEKSWSFSEFIIFFFACT